MDNYGLPYTYSGLMSYGVATDHLNDAFVEPDIEIPSESWYDDPALLSAINNAEKVYTLTVTGGSGSGVYKAGDFVTIQADTPPNGKVFDRWTWNLTDAPPFTIGNQSVTTTTFVMPASDLIMTANFKQAPSVQGCYVATAVYGSYDCPEVWTLRRFRDDVLAKTWYGRLFIHLYYAISPTAVRLFGETRWFQDFWHAKLDHMVSDLQANGFASTPYKDIDW